MKIIFNASHLSSNIERNMLTKTNNYSNTQIYHPTSHMLTEKILEGHVVRVMIIGNKPWFCGIDLSKPLEKSKRAIQQQIAKLKSHLVTAFQLRSTDGSKGRS